MTEHPLGGMARSLEILAERMARKGRAIPGLENCRRRLRDIFTEPNAPRRSEAQRRLDLESGGWRERALEGLAPEVQARVGERLRYHRASAGLVGPDPWITLDHDASRALEEQIHRLQLEAKGAALLSANRFVETEQFSFFREAVRALEAAIAAERRLGERPILVNDAWRERECLGNALRDVLPPAAFAFVSGEVRSWVEGQLPKEPARTEAGRPRRVGNRQVLSDSSWEAEAEIEDPVGEWFDEPMQTRYQKAMAKARDREEALAQLRRAAAAPRPPRIAKRVEPAQPKKPEINRVEEPSEDYVVIHFVEDGVTGLNRVWVRGQELHLRRDSPGWKRSLDLNGSSWLEQTAERQIERWGVVKFRPGPWPGDPWPPGKEHFYRKNYSEEGSWNEPDHRPEAPPRSDYRGLTGAPG